MEEISDQYSITGSEGAVWHTVASVFVGFWWCCHVCCCSLSESCSHHLLCAPQMAAGKVKKPGKRGRKPAKIDLKAKLERSRQSARECRARKKLRYQYLEELVSSKERAICALREELEMVRSLRGEPSSTGSQQVLEDEKSICDHLQKSPDPDWWGVGIRCFQMFLTGPVWRVDGESLSLCLRQRFIELTSALV